jgi:hypothetical protein
MEILLGMCYIICMTSYSVCYVVLGARGVRGKRPQDFFCLGKCATFFPRFLCRLDFHVHCWAVFQHMVFADGFLFLAKELGLLTNPVHWVTFLDVVGSYMYIVV